MSTALADYHFVDVGSTNPVAPYTDYMKAASSIQAAVDQAQAGDVVVVGPGAYYSGTRATPGAALLNRVVVTNAVIVQSAYGSDATAIVGAGPVGASAVRCAYLGNGATLSGFTLTNGCTLAAGDALKDCSGGGAYAVGGGIIDSCVINGNVAAADGGGVCGGTVSKCVIMGNTADSGGGTAGGTMYNCLIASNTAAQFGGGAYLGTLNNCTVCGNMATSGGGTSESGVNNCIVYYNSAGTDTNWHIGAFSHSCTFPDPGGSGNTSDPPQFVDYPNDLHLASGSPCIDAGDNTYAVGDTDLDGSKRIMNTVVDMGAYEFFYVTVNGRVTLDYTGLEGVIVSDGTRSNLTDASGNYTLSGIAQGPCTLMAYKSNYIFQPATLTVTITNSDAWGQDFTAERFRVIAAINCGGPEYAASNGVVYAADTNYSDGTVWWSDFPIENTPDSLLYQDVREGGSYSVPMSNGNYLLTLKFAETRLTANTSRVFSVMAGESEVLRDFDIFYAATGSNIAYDVTVPTTVTNNTLDITFISGAGSLPMVNAILVTLDETGLVSGPMGTPAWWLRQYGLTNNTIDVDELDDPDGDGAATWKEYVAGTDPTNGDSVFCVADASQSVSGRLEIVFATVTGKTYRVTVATNLVSRWATCPYAITTNGTMRTAVITATVDRTTLYVLPSNVPSFFRAKIDVPLSHPFDAAAYGGHYYKVFESDLTWHDAKVKCEDMGGYLACVESAGEQAFLAMLANGRYLSLGGTDEGGPWTWVNGSPWGFTDWDAGQPNGALTGVEFYLELYNGGRWNDVAERTSDYDFLHIPVNWMPVGYICEWER